MISVELGDTMYNILHTSVLFVATFLATCVSMTRDFRHLLGAPHDFCFLRVSALPGIFRLRGLGPRRRLLCVFVRTDGEGTFSPSETLRVCGSARGGTA